MNFDTIIPRRGTGSIKWDRRPDLDPYWVADMDFTSPPSVIEALQKRVEHGIFGYAHAHDGLNEAVLGYLKQKHGRTLQVADIMHLGGLVPALSLAARGFGQAGDSVLTCTPVYYPFLGVARDAGMTTLTVPHVEVDGKWTFDWEQLEATVRPDTKVFLLCSPQNPLGRCFSKEEIIKVAEFCHRHDLALVADEIHCDLVLDEEKTPFFSTLNLPEHLRQKLIVLQAPSKTYNIAGLGYAFAVIENESTRRKFSTARGFTLPEINCLSFYAAEAAYRGGESWRQELLTYLSKNRDTLTEFIRREIPQIKVPNIEATYLALLDCRELKLDNPSLHLEKDAGLWMSDGVPFGAPGHIRINYGCPHARLLEGLEKMNKSFQKIL